MKYYVVGDNELFEFPTKEEAQDSMELANAFGKATGPIPEELTLKAAEWVELQRLVYAMHDLLDNADWADVDEARQVINRMDGFLSEPIWRENGRPTKGKEL